MGICLPSILVTLSFEVLQAEKERNVKNKTKTNPTTL
jgi:hypothetical protein